MKDVQENYETEDLKVTHVPKKPKLNLPGMEEEEKPKEMTGMEAFTTVALLLFGYIIYAILPTVVFMKALDFGFWAAQGFTFVLAIVLVFSFGLHKEASPELLAKRKKRRRI